MRYFPLFIDLEGAKVLLVGGSEEALRKARLLAKTPARITLVAEHPLPELLAMPQVDWAAKDFKDDQLEGIALVFVADRHLAETVSAAARVRGLPVNAVDDAQLSNILVPSIVDRDPVIVAIGTEGTAPVLGQGLRAQIDALLPQRIGALARRAQGLRGLIAQRLTPGLARRSFWQRFFFGDIARHFFEEREAAYHQAVNSLLIKAEPAKGRIVYIAANSEDSDLLSLKAQRRLMEADLIVHEGHRHTSLLEMARRDAKRTMASGQAIAPTLIDSARQGLLVVRLCDTPQQHAEECFVLAAAGIDVEYLAPAIHQSGWPAQIFNMGPGDTLSDHLLRAIS